MNVDDIDLSAEEFWALPQEQRDAAFTVLRKDRPFSFYAEPVLPFVEPGAGYYAVVRHADVAAISSQPKLFCSGQGATSIPDMPPELVEFYGSMISMDDPRHAKIRRIVSKAFTPRMLEKLVDSVEVIFDGILDDARAVAEQNNGTFDLVRHISSPLPLKVICRMMGIDEADDELVLEQSNLILSGGDPEFIPDENEALRLVLEAGMALASLMEKLAADRLEMPTDDLTSALVHTEVDGEKLSHQEIASFFILLCVAGNETTRTAISNGVWALHEFPEQKKRWVSDGSLAKTAVEEIVRWASPVIWMRRTATQDVELSGQQFKAGDKLLLFYNSANRDEQVFDNPFTLDVARDPNLHYGFGAPGPHFCLGAHLARREIDIAFRKMFERMPNLEPASEPDRLQSSFINGIKRLPVRLS
jgi:cytochrome P450